jgi:hypothetical protein
VLSAYTVQPLKKLKQNLHHKCHSKIYPDAQKIPLKDLGIAKLKMKLSEKEKKKNRISHH